MLAMSVTLQAAMIICNHRTRIDWMFMWCVGVSILINVCLCVCACVRACKRERER